MEEKNRLFTPGPTMVPARLLEIAASQLPYNRTEEFSQITFEIFEGLKYIFGTNGEVVIFAASGTGAMEASVFNFLDQNDKILIVNGGTFGLRWVKLCEQHKIPYEQIQLDIGKSLSLGILDQKLSEGNYSTLLINAHETSTGMLNDTESIGNLTLKHGVFFIVDAISTICADSFLMDKWHVDVALLSSQKALALPPGLSFLALNDQAKERLKTKSCRSYYFDIKEYLVNQTRGQMPFTPVISHFIMLHARLEEIKTKKINYIIAQHSILAKYFRNAIKDLPFSFLSKNPSNALTAIKCHKGIDAMDLVLRLAEDFKCFVAPNAGDLKHKVFRVCHLGEQNTKDIDFLIHAIKTTLRLNIKNGEQMKLERRYYQ